jgi:uncharacterized membrane protein
VADAIVADDMMLKSYKGRRILAASSISVFSLSLLSSLCLSSVSVSVVVVWLCGCVVVLIGLRIEDEGKLDIRNHNNHEMTNAQNQ